METSIERTPKFKIGDRVTFTNDYGVIFHNKIISSIVPADKMPYGEEPGYNWNGDDTPWYPHKESSLKLESLSDRTRGHLTVAMAHLQSAIDAMPNKRSAATAVLAAVERLQQSHYNSVEVRRFLHSTGSNKVMSMQVADLRRHLAKVLA